MTIYTTQGLKKRIEGLEEAKNSQIETSKKKKKKKKKKMEKEMATHSSILAWKVPWTEEPDGL